MKKRCAHFIYAKGDTRHCGVPGVYFLYKNKEVLYIGQSVNVSTRIDTHIRDGVIDFDGYRFFEISKEDLIVIESALIKKYNPPYNDINYYVSQKGKIQKPSNPIGGLSECEYCKGSFFKKTTWHRYCCDKCKLASYIEKRESEGKFVGTFYKKLYNAHLQQ